MTGSLNPSNPRTPADLVASAVQTEREAAWFYKMMAEMTSDEEAKETLLTLAEDEASHATTLANLYYEITGRGITEKTPNRAEGDPNLFDLSSASRRDALEFALKNEVTAADFYQEQADDADNPRVATIFRILADTERDHAAYLQLQIQRLDTARKH